MAGHRRARRWAALGVLAALELFGQGFVQAQDGLLPPISSTPVRSRLPRSAYTAPPAPAPAVSELILEPGPTTPAPFAHEAPGTGPTRVPPPDDGLGARIRQPATSPACVAPEPKPGCADAKSGDRFAKVPPVAPLPRTGWAPIPPTGPGFYTLFDWLEDDERETPPKYPYPRISPIMNPFFDIDWRYLDDPNNTETDFWDFLKRRRFGPDDAFLFTGGGELRLRYTYEGNSRLFNGDPARFRGRDNNYDLIRFRAYGDMYFTERFRLYAEFISATSPDFLLPPLPIDRDQADFLNLFVDANLFDVADTPVWLRVGRQELLYGSQRLISPLDWANTRRTFQGIKAFWHAAKDDFDVFVVQPVIPFDVKFDSLDNNVLFAGAWYTHRPKPGNAIDAYYLLLDNTNPTNTGRFDVKGGYTVHTVGARWVGDQDNWLWDFEVMLQFGEFVNRGHFAQAYTMGGGYNFKDVCGTPQAWLYFDHASGTPDPGSGHL